MASDSAATFGNGVAATIGQQTVKKVHKLANAMVFASTGAVGIGQVLGDALTHAWNEKRFRDTQTPERLMNAVGTCINQTAMPYLQTASAVRQVGAGDGSSSWCKSMVAMDCKGTPCLFTFDVNGAPERASNDLPFVAMGSGQAIADPFLAFLKRLIWAQTPPTLAEGKLVATWTIDHVCKTNPGGVGGAVQLMVLTKGGGIVEISGAELNEHSQQANGAEQAMLRALRPAAQPEQPAPPMPTPPP